MNILQVEQLSKRFGGVQAVSQVSFEVKTGEILGLIGPNGAGKTTLFNLISGTLRPDEGQIFFSKRDITGKKSYQVCSEGICRTFQIVRPFSQMTCLENVLVPLSIFEKEHDQSFRKEKAVNLLELTGLEGKKNLLAGQLNLIDKKRLELARGLATKPRLLMLDEVLGGLNTMEMEQALDLIRQIRKNFKLTIIWIEHIMGAIMRLSDRIIVLDQGRLISEGKPSQVASDPRVIQAYLGEQHA